MKIFFGASTSRFPEFKDYYTAIRDLLVEDGHVITRDWLNMYKNDFLNNPKRFDFAFEKAPVYEAVLKAAMEAEMLIFEDTVSSFSNGHLMTLALQRQKPVLVMWIKGKKKTYLKTSFIHGIKSDYLQISEYSMENYRDVVRSFINKYEKHYQRHRFNLVIDEVEKKYLDWASHKYNKTRTRLIKDAIRSKLEHDDEYKSYLS